MVAVMDCCHQRAPLTTFYSNRAFLVRLPSDGTLMALHENNAQTCHWLQYLMLFCIILQVLHIQKNFSFYFTSVCTACPCYAPPPLFLGYWRYICASRETLSTYEQTQLAKRCAEYPLIIHHRKRQFSVCWQTAGPPSRCVLINN